MKQIELMPLLHEPSLPVRQDVIGEVVFVEAWQRLMDVPVEFPLDVDCDTMLDDVLSHYPYSVGQREATVCASIICWLGTNCGLGFLHECKKLAEMFPSYRREHAYLAAWTIENSRSPGVNSGVRTLEHILSDTIGRTGVLGNLGRIPASPSADDYECAECLIKWLSTTKGQDFLKYCEMEIQLRYRQKQNKFPFGG